MGDLGKGWLELCSEEEYQAAASAACGATTTPCASRVDPSQIEKRATAPLWPRGEAGVFLQALPPGFDMRSREMYWQLTLRDQRESAPLAQLVH